MLDTHQQSVRVSDLLWKHAITQLGGGKSYEAESFYHARKIFSAPVPCEWDEEEVNRISSLLMGTVYLWLERQDLRLYDKASVVAGVNPTVVNKCVTMTVQLDLYGKIE